MGKKGQKKQKLVADSGIPPSIPSTHNVNEQAQFATIGAFETEVCPRNNATTTPAEPSQPSCSSEGGGHVPVDSGQTHCASAYISMPTSPVTSIIPSTSPASTSAASTTRLQRQTSPVFLSIEVPAHFQRLSNDLDRRGSTSSEMSEMSDRQVGSSPLVVACLSCNVVCVITKRVSYNRTKLGLRSDCHDRFVPTICDKCQEDNARTWLQIAADVHPPPRELQYPSTISTQLLADWFVYRLCRSEFHVSFDASELPNKRVTRARDWWREGCLMDKTANWKYLKPRSWPVQDGEGSGTKTKTSLDNAEEITKVIFFGQPAVGKSV